MSESRVERVAKAIFLCGYYDPDDRIKSWPDRIVEVVSGPPFDAEGYRDMARAAIKAMSAGTKSGTRAAVKTRTTAKKAR